MILSFLLISQEIGILRESIIYQGHSISSWKKLDWKPSLTLESRLQAVGTLPFAHPILALPTKVILQWVRLSPCVVSLAAQSCPTFCDTTDCSTPGSLSITNSWSLLKLMSIDWRIDVFPFSSRLQSFPVSGSFPMSQFFTWDGQSTGVSASASVLPMNIQDKNANNIFEKNWPLLLCLGLVGKWLSWF